MTAAGAAAPLVANSWVASSPKKSMNLLVLGGTAFLGPHFVRAAMARGHEVTLFNRGKTNPKMFRELEQLRGDRDKYELGSLKGRKWDAVVDTSGYVPGHVKAAAELLRDHVGYYQFISTISVYDPFREQPQTIDETAKVTTVTDEINDSVKTIRESFEHYGAMKARCEAAAEAAMPGRVVNIRPGLIVGPLDRSDRFTWWPVRMDRGGEVLVPGDRDHHSQFLDVRDLADWMLHCIEQKVVGVYNANGFHGLTMLSEVLGACKCATDKEVKLTGVSDEFLIANKVRPYMDLPLWLPPDLRRLIDNRRAIAAGMKFRPIADTVRDTLQWAKAERGDRPYRTGLKPDRERDLLKKWREQAGAGGTGR